MAALALATATLATAGDLWPLQCRLRTAVDRRFNRAAVDARSAVDELRGLLRGVSNLDEVTADVLRTVHTAMQPATVRL